jgi:hypothetical protein
MCPLEAAEDAGFEDPALSFSVDNAKGHTENPKTILEYMLEGSNDHRISG